MAPRVVLGVALAFALALAAGCQNSEAPPSPDAGPHYDAAIGVMCGGGVCASATSAGCCTGTGGAPACVDTAGTCTGKLMACDGPEDCAGGTSCCILTAGGTSCTAASACESEGAVACTSSADCTGNKGECCNGVCAAQCTFW